MHIATYLPLKPDDYFGSEQRRWENLQGAKYVTEAQLAGILAQRRALLERDWGELTIAPVSGVNVFPRLVRFAFHSEAFEYDASIVFRKQSKEFIVLSTREWLEIDEDGRYVAPWLLIDYIQTFAPPHVKSEEAQERCTAKHDHERVIDGWVRASLPATASGWNIGLIGVISRDEKSEQRFRAGAVRDRFFAARSEIRRFTALWLTHLKYNLSHEAAIFPLNKNRARVQRAIAEMSM